MHTVGCNNMCSVQTLIVCLLVYHGHQHFLGCIQQCIQRATTSAKHLSAATDCGFDKFQVCEHLQRVGKVCGVWAVPIVGGISPIKQERLLKKLPEVSCFY